MLQDLLFIIPVFSKILRLSLLFLRHVRLCVGHPMDYTHIFASYRKEREHQFKLPYTVSWRRQWHPTPVLLPGKSHGWRSLVGCSPWGRWELDTTEQLHFHFSLSCTGEGNGNPLQFSYLENPRDEGAWWAAIYGVTQSWTRLKWLSSSRPTIYSSIY